jgi:hypothetical protein
MTPNLNGAKLIGSETVPLASGAGVSLFLRTIYAMFVSHWDWWTIDPLIFDSIGAVVFFYMRYINTQAVHMADYRDQILQAKVAKEWAAVPIPVELLIEWANSKAQQPPSDVPSPVPTPVPSQPVGPGQTVRIATPQTNGSIPSSPIAGTSGPAATPAPPPVT